MGNFGKYSVDELQEVVLADQPARMRGQADGWALMEKLFRDQQAALSKYLDNTTGSWQGGAGDAYFHQIRRVATAMEDTSGVAAGNATGWNGIAEDVSANKDGVDVIYREWQLTSGEGITTQADFDEARRPYDERARAVMDYTADATLARQRTHMDVPPPLDLPPEPPGGDDGSGAPGSRGSGGPGSRGTGSPSGPPGSSDEPRLQSPGPGPTPTPGGPVGAPPPAPPAPGPSPIPVPTPVPPRSGPIPTPPGPRSMPPPRGPRPTPGPGPRTGPRPVPPRPTPGPPVGRRPTPPRTGPIPRGPIGPRPTPNPPGPRPAPPRSAPIPRGPIGPRPNPGTQPVPAPPTRPTPGPRPIGTGNPSFPVRGGRTVPPVIGSRPDRPVGTGQPTGGSRPPGNGLARPVIGGRTPSGGNGGEPRTSGRLIGKDGVARGGARGVRAVRTPKPRFGGQGAMNRAVITGKSAAKPVVNARLQTARDAKKLKRREERSYRHEGGDVDWLMPDHVTVPSVITGAVSVERPCDPGPVIGPRHPADPGMPGESDEARVTERLSQRKRSEDGPWGTAAVVPGVIGARPKPKPHVQPEPEQSEGGWMKVF